MGGREGAVCSEDGQLLGLVSDRTRSLRKSRKPRHRCWPWGVGRSGSLEPGIFVVPEGGHLVRRVLGTPSTVLTAVGLPGVRSPL